MYAPDDISSVYGHSGIRLSPTLAAFVNGVAVSNGGHVLVILWACGLGIAPVRTCLGSQGKV